MPIDFLTRSKTWMERAIKCISPNIFCDALMQLMMMYSLIGRAVAKDSDRQDSEGPLNALCARGGTVFLFIIFILDLFLAAYLVRKSNRWDGNKR